MATPKGRAISSESAEELDLSKYKSAELAENILEIVSIPDLFMQIAKTAFVAVFIAVAVACTMWVFAIAEGLTLFLVTAYAIALAVVFGIVLGILRVVRNSLINVDEVLDHLLKISGFAVDDLSALHSGTQRIPSGDVVLSKVYDDVIMPTVETVVSDSFGFFGKPILWFYRRTIGSAVRYVIKRTATSKVSPEDLETLRTGVVESVTALANDDTSETRLYIARAQRIVDSVGNGLQSYAIRPLLIALTTLLIFALIPIAIALWV